MLEKMPHGDVVHTDIRDATGTRTEIAKNRQHLVVELETALLHQLENGDGRHRLGKTRQPEHARGLDGDAAFPVGKSVAANQHELALARHRERPAGDVPFSQECGHDLVVGLQTEESRPGWTRMGLRGREDHEDDGSDELPHQAQSEYNPAHGYSPRWAITLADVCARHEA